MGVFQTTRARVKTCALKGVEGLPVTVEIEVSGGSPGMTIVGMADTGVKEAGQRVRSAVRASGFSMPSNRRILVNLTPASVRKSGAGFDLPIAVAFLIASGQVPAHAFENMLVVGELTLNGDVRPVNGLFAYALSAKKQGLSLLSAPLDGGMPDLPGLECNCIANLGRLHVGELDPQPLCGIDCKAKVLDFKDVVGQETAVRAMTIAAAGAHGVMLVGPPGSGKSMIARRLPSILPPLTEEERVQTAVIHSVAGLDISTVACGLRPFRAPHHSSTVPAMVGGGSPLRPGEASLAHNGVLFLDELGEFSVASLQALRQPLEDGAISLARADGCAVFPARFQLVAATNPCPCGYLGDKEQTCRCSETQINRYQGKLGGPLRDRIDLVCEVSRVDPSKVLRTGEGKGSNALRNEVMAARERVFWRDSHSKALASTVPREVIEACGLSASQRKLVEDIARRCSLSGRGIIRTLRVARTIADLEDKEKVADEHLYEALMFRGAQGME